MEQGDIKKRREELNVSQAQISRMLGVSPYKISSYEIGEEKIPKECLDRLSDLFEKIKAGEIIVPKKKKRTIVNDGISIIASRPRRTYQRTQRNIEYLHTLDELSNRFHQQINDNNPTAISFFAGCGGLCYGLKAAGFNIVAANELVPEYQTIHHYNFPTTINLPNDIKNVSPTDIYHALNGREIDLFAGGPPCQGFSIAGKRDVDDERNTLFQYYLSLANEIRPRVIIMENVRQLLTMKNPSGGYVRNDIIHKFNQIGYNSEFFIVNASDYGVPQSRERVIFVGIRADLHLEPSIAEPDYVQNNLFQQRPPFTFGDAVSDLEFIENGEVSINDPLHKASKHPEHVLRWLIDVPEGRSAHENADPSLRPSSGFNTTYKRQVWNQSGATVTTNSGMISGCNNVHPIATRALTIRETLRLQSFPDSYIINGPEQIIRTVIGNAVPPILAYKIGRHIIETYLNQTE